MKKYGIMKFSSVVLSLLMLFTSVLGAFPNKVYAQSNIISELTVNKTEITQGQSFTVNVKFGGSGTKVVEGQTEEINFALNNTKIDLPSSPIELRNSSGVILGEVTFVNNKAIMKFNKLAASLDDIEGGFDFYVTGYWANDPNTPGEGSIDISYNGGTKRVKFINNESGTTTENIYSKKGVWSQHHPDGNRLDWVFTFNAAHKSADTDTTFTVEDTLDNTMEWDTDENNTNQYRVEVCGKWVSLEQAKQMNIGIEFNGKNLKISIPTYIFVDNQWVRPLDGKELTVRLTAKVTEETMKNKSIKYVTNESNPNVTGVDWEIDPKEAKDSVEIMRSGGWATGTKPGELKIVKKLKNKDIPIKDVEFILEREDKQDIEVREESGYVNKGKSIVLTTNEEGIASIKGLKATKYILKENKAPEWITFDINQPITKTFEVKDSDSEGKELTIENDKKTINIGIEKIWKDANGQIITSPENIKVQLYRDGKKVGQAVELSSVKTKYSWENLDVSDDNGKLYNYEVKELDSDENAINQNGSIELTGKWYGVSYEGSMKDGFTITNKEKTPWTPMTPPTRDVKVTKDWKGSDGNKIESPVDSVKVELYKDGIATGNVKELNKENNWTVTFEKLPVSATLGGENHKYTIKEVGENKNNIELTGKWYGVSYEGSMKDGFTITNKETPTKPSTPTPNDPGSNKPVVPSTSNNKTLPKTGDGSNVSQYAWLMLTSGVLLMLIGYRRKNQV
ncbi:Cna B-type domain-containing protein [Streptococcus gordonii]|uniref:Cna B-type domain-containing protein n=2 Tax=Streptococcus gordonii TaxID=1302 RepID=UPI002283709B|nr:Cna B-type domain-containing protein [Streptococcus gordonii]MCY7140780.1 Cna B-type domain-containing protein [Streptococcus gordonii]